MSQTQVAHADSIHEEEHEMSQEKKQKSRRPPSKPWPPALLPQTADEYRHRLSTAEIESMAVSRPLEQPKTCSDNH